MADVIVSLIVPVYNDYAYLHISIPELINQNFDEYELILVDDGSTDGSATVLDEFARGRSHVKVLHKPNGGVSSARNAGLKIAKGDWVVFADSDDIVSRDYLKHLYEAVGDCDLAWHGETKIFNNGVEIAASCSESRKIDVSNPSEVISMLHNTWMTNFPGPCCKIYRRELFVSNSVYMEEDMVFGEDFECLLRLLEKCKNIKMISGCAQDYRYYQNSDSITYKTATFEREFNSIIKLKAAIEHFMQAVSIEGEIKLFNSTIHSGKQRVIRSIYSNTNEYTKKERIAKLKELRNSSISQLYFNKKTKSNRIVSLMASIGLWGLVDRFAQQGFLS